MTELIYLFAVAAGLAGVLATISVWAPRRLWAKVTALGTAGLLLPAAYAGLAQLLGVPKPIGHEWWLARAADATVLGSSLREGEAIYLWLQLDGAVEPRAYVLPWSRELAQQLQAAEREAGQRQGELRMRLPFENSLDDREPRFYATPQPQLPPKATDPPAPQIHRAPPQGDHA